ncbi:carbohydrate esterase family 4 protein [Hypoxylon sp. CI-4A]|nr:carbohydrate esterase family 4 protein [Hypoxylon sp. CI-4A]
MTRVRKGDIPYGQAIFHCKKPGHVALTFDDGPAYWTNQILDQLDAAGFRATFFITGNNPALSRRVDDEMSEYPDMLRRMHLAGHQLASHTWTHPHLEQIGWEGVVREMVYNEMAMRNVLGVVPTYMRPPYGVWRDKGINKIMRALGYHVVMYDVDTKDYMHHSPDNIQKAKDVFDHTLDPLGVGSYLVLSHDIHQQTAMELVPHMILTMRLRGFKAVTVGTCLGDDDWMDWYRVPE